MEEPLHSGEGCWDSNKRLIKHSAEGGQERGEADEAMRLKTGKPVKKRPAAQM